MRQRGKASCVVALVVAAMARSSGAETGDIDGDGQVTLGDVVALNEGRPPASGSLDGLESFPCAGWDDTYDFSGALYVEALRRSVPGSLPHWWSQVWNSVEAPKTVLAQADEVSTWVEFATAPGGDDDSVTLSIAFSSTVPWKTFYLILDSDGLVRPRFNTPESGWEWNEKHWNWAPRGLPPSQEEPVSVRVSPAGYLATGGRLVVSGPSDPLLALPDVPPGVQGITVEARLPAGTTAGSHALRILESSQVVLADGRVVRPRIEPSVDLTVGGAVKTGWDEGLPPLKIDGAGRRVLGKVEFRVVNRDGQPAEPGKPVAADLPGNDVVVRVQMRTETPLNHVYYSLEWPSSDIVCSLGIFDSAIAQFTNPEDGQLYKASACQHAPTSTTCFNAAFGSPPSHRATFQLAGGARCGYETNYLERPLEYFKPLGEWTDLAELTLVISPTVPGGKRIPLGFERADPADDYNDKARSRAHFAPYSGAFICPEEYQTGKENWRYDIRFENAYIQALGAGPGEPQELPDADLHVIVGEPSAAPGDVVEVPVFASAKLDPLTLRLAFEMDPAAVSVDEADFTVYSLGRREFTRLVVPRGGSAALHECEDLNGDGIPDRQCTFGVPSGCAFETTENRFVLLSISNPDFGFADAPRYPGEELVEVLRLRVKIREGFTGTETAIRPSIALWKPGAFELEAVTGGEYPVVPGSLFTFVPAVEARGGTIHVAPRQFLRGDSNADAKVDLSDAVATLGHLFLGSGDLACLEAADADDSGSVEITDPIFLLGALFLGQNALPPPFPDCGTETGASNLGCKEGCLAR